MVNPLRQNGFPVGFLPPRKGVEEHYELEPFVVRMPTCTTVKKEKTMKTRQWVVELTTTITHLPV